MTLHDVIILIKSVLKKDKNHYYYNMLKNNHKSFVHSIIMWRFGETKVTKEKFYIAKKSIKIWDVNVGNIVISKVVKTKADSKYLNGYLDKAIRPLVLIMPKISGYVKTFEVKVGDKYKNNKLMSFRIDDEKL